MKKGAIIGIIVAVLGIALSIAGYFVFSKNDLDTAIDEFEDGDYRDSILMLNRLARTADYETGEKIYYYRCRAINGLASKLEQKFSDELIAISQEKQLTEDVRETRRELEEYLKDVNREIGGDLALVPAMKKSRILHRGAFYEEFISRYRGSSLIEDIQFEEARNLGKTEPDRLVPAMINFYNRYPNTDYIASMVKIILDGLQAGSFSVSGNEEVLWQMIISYVKRYPTSPETARLFTCTGENVNLRNHPGVNGKLVGKINRDEILIQLEKSMDTTQVGDVRDYWYRVASLRGPRGWIFGKFLAPVDLSKYQEPATGQNWPFEEHFTEWNDSHTPVNWVHIPTADTAGINFSMQGGKKIAGVNSARGSAAGLYSRFNASRAFTVMSRARFTGGDAVTVFAYVPTGDTAFYVKLMADKADICGRTIPLRTMEWHEYTLESDDGRFARLIVDGETLSSRIEPVKSKYFSLRGLYCLFSSTEENSRGEMEYIKAR